VLDFFETPRAVGDPFQQIVKTEEEIMNFINPRLGKTPVFISHNAYPTFTKTGEVFQIKVNKFFFDFDSPKKPENAQLDVIKVIEFCERENLQIYPAFSGSKGFHAYIPLEPKTYLLGSYLKDATQAVHLWLKAKLGLRTIDLKCAEPKRLCRVWYTPHITIKEKKVIASGMYCCPLDPAWIKDWQIDKIMEYAKHPTAISYRAKGDILSLEDFIKRFEIDVKKILSSCNIGLDETGAKMNKICEYKPINDAFIQLIVPYPCITNQIMNNPNPPHCARFDFVAHLATLGYSKKWIFDFLKSRNYKDFKPDVTAYQINNIFDKKYKISSCKKRYSEGICVGACCPLFEEFAKTNKITLESEKT